MSIILALAARFSLVALFFPFSAFDKMANASAAVAQASQATDNRNLARMLIVLGLAVEVVGSLAVLTGVCDRLAAFALAGYCGVTALLWKQFWREADFRLIGPSRGRETFWDFLKNFAVAGGFLMLAFGGGDALGVSRFFAHPLESSHPYQTGEKSP